MKSDEHQSQVALMRWAMMQELVMPELALLHAIPNGGKRSIRTATKLKNEGVKAGVPDLFLPVPRAGKHGLYVEMKSAKGSLSTEQRVWRDRLTEQGYGYCVARNAEQAATFITRYLQGLDLEA